MSDALLDFVAQQIELNESSLNRENVSKQITVDLIFKLLSERLTGRGVCVKKQHPLNVHSMEYISIEGDSLECYPQSVLGILDYVDKIEIYPRTDDKFQINLIFYNLKSQIIKGVEG